MAWLYDNYFLPLLTPSTAMPKTRASSDTLRQHLQTYKTLQKKLTRDASLYSSVSPEVSRVLRDIEHWIAVSRVDAAVLGNVCLDLPPHNSDDPTELDGVHLVKASIDSQERWALERLCDVLIERGALVPVSKRYA
jgi:ribosomal biogenesis protein LAS1